MPGDDAVDEAPLRARRSGDRPFTKPSVDAIESGAGGACLPGNAGGAPDLLALLLLLLLLFYYYYYFRCRS